MIARRHSQWIYGIALGVGFLGIVTVSMAQVLEVDPVDALNGDPLLGTVRGGSDSGGGVEVEGDFLTGDKRLACEAVLCLSSRERPSECNRSLAKYFAIKFLKPWKTIRARKKFLDLCPSGEYDGKAAHVEVLASGAETCEMNNLIAELNIAEPPYTKALPQQCRSFVNHEFTTGFTLPVRKERCSEAHLADVGPRPIPQEEQDPWSEGGVYVVNQAELDEYDRRGRLQDFHPFPICVSRWTNPEEPISTELMEGLLHDEFKRVEAASEAKFQEEEALFLAQQRAECEDAGIYGEGEVGFDPSLNGQDNTVYCQSLLAHD